MSICLCVVARNESAFLRECLDSARPVVDDMVVVDTGSTDGTAEIARAAGARVFTEPWPGDLGRAHNLPLAHARADWILSLDGDEALDCASRHLIRDLVHDPAIDGYRLPIRNYSYFPEVKMRWADAGDPRTRGALCFYPTAVVRLHRHRPETRHEGWLHQSLEPSIAGAGRRIADAEVVIHHYGGLRVRHEKTDLYRILARRQIADTPDAARAWLAFGMLFARERIAGALDAFRRAHALGLRGPAAFMIGCGLVDMGHARAATRWLREAIRLNPADDSPHYDRADAYESLAAAYEALGEPRRAERACARALRLRETSPTAANNLAGLLGERGAADRARAMIDRLLDRAPGLTMAWATRGVLRLQSGDLHGAREALETALDIHPANGAALVNLAIVHQAAGRHRDAARAVWAAEQSAVAQVPALPAGLTAKRHRHASSRMPPGAVVSIIPALHGGAGQVAVDVVRALRERPQLVLCADTGTFAGQGLEEAMAAEGAAIGVVGSDTEVVEKIALARPAVVVDHCGAYFFVNGPPRISGERWIAIAHGALSLPYGYDAYVAISAFNARYQRHLPPERVHRIANGVDLVRFRPRHRHGTGPVTIAALSRLDPGKLPRQLLSYLPHLPSLGASLAIAGRGARRAELEPVIRARGLAGSIRFVGVVAPARIPAFLGGADIGLHLTETEQEACSLAVLEMLASGLPIVGQPRGCLPELVIDGENGYLRDDPAEIAECLVALIRSPDLRARMGARSRRLAQGYGMARYRRAIRRLVLRDAPAPTPKPRRSIEPQDISLAGWTPALTYLICTTRRSGGTLLCEALASTGVAGFPDESFVAAFDRSLEEDDHDEFCRRLLRRVEARTTPNGVFGAKIFVEDLERLIVRLGSPPAGKAPFELLTSRLPRLRLIYLSRRDRLRQAISLVRAEQSGRWSHNDRPVARVRLDRARIRRALGSIAADTAKWDAFFAAWPAAPIRVHYEDLAARYEATALAVVRQLGIETVAPIVFARRRLVRQADALTERWVRRMRGDRDARARHAPSP